MKNRKVIFITGECSGDLHASAVAKNLKKISPGISILAVGGKGFQQAGIPLIAHIRDLSVLGLVEVLRHYKRLWGLKNKIADRIRSENPDLLVLVDFPGFNLSLARQLKKSGIPVLYYISPQIWAWHYERIHLIRKLVNSMIVLLPFEEDLYRKEGVPVHYFGHPLAWQIRPGVKKRSSFRPKILLMPGSRTSEIRSLMPVLADLEIRLQKEFNAQVMYACADTVSPQNLREQAGRKLTAPLQKGKTYQLMKQADLVITASGTASLEASLFLTPVIVLYKVHPVSWVLFRFLSRVSFISLTNILLKKEVIPEFFRPSLKVNEIMAEAGRILQNKPYRQNMTAGLYQVRKKLEKGNSYLQTAQYIRKKLLNKTKIF